MRRTIPAVDIERGAKLRALRERSGRLQRQVGAAFDIDKAAVASWESGRSKPSIDRLGELDRLYGGTGEVLALFGVIPPVASAGDVMDRVRRLERAVRVLLELAVQGGAELPADVRDVVRALG